MQVSLLSIVGELAGGGSVAVTFGIREAIQKTTESLSMLKPTGGGQGVSA